MKRWGWGVLIVLALVLAGCGEQAAREAEGLYEQVTGIPAGQVLLTVDGREVPAWRYFYWLAYNCDYLSEARDAEGRVLNWEEDQAGQTVAQYVKQQALDTAVLYAVIGNWAESYGCADDAGDQTAIDQEWTALCSRYGGETRCLGELAWMGLDRSRADEFTRDYLRYSRLRELAATPGSALSPSEAELEAFTQETGSGIADWLDSRLRQAARDAAVTLAPEYEAIDPADFAEKLADARSRMDRSGETTGVFGPSEAEASGA